MANAPVVVPHAGSNPVLSHLRAVFAELLQLVLDGGQRLLCTGLVQMAARGTGHANRTNGVVGYLHGHAACQHHNTYPLTVDSNVFVEYGTNGPAATTVARTNPAICAQCSAGICGVYASTRSCISRTPSGTVPQLGCGLDRPVGGAPASTRGLPVR